MKSNIRFLTLNVGMKKNLAGLINILLNQRLDVAFLQEVKVTDEELGSKIEAIGYNCKVNIDIGDAAKPGTAIVWRSSLPVTDVTNLVPCRAQVACLEDYVLLNLYAPSGSDKKFERASFFLPRYFQSFQSFPRIKVVIFVVNVIILILEVIIKQR